MATDTIAPWAEPVYHTAEELLALSDRNWRYELVEGRLVRKAPTNIEHSDVCGNLYLALRSFVDGRGLGRVTLPETGFLIRTDPDTVLAPDLAFIRADRLPSPLPVGFPGFAPDLAVEIASPSQHRPEMGAKARLWLGSGCGMVWVIWPATREVDCWTPAAAEPRTLTDADMLTEGALLPGFEFPVSRFW